LQVSIFPAGSVVMSIACSTAAMLAARPGTTAASCRNLASRRGKPVAERPRPITAAASWLVAAAVC
jgi:hypothetical protein